LYDALPNYYIKKMKEANNEPIEMNFEELFQFALNIEEAVINPGKDSEGNPWNSKEQRTETTIPPKQRGKGKDHKKSGGKSSILKGQELPSCDFCGRKGHTETACRIKQKAMAYDKKDTKDRSTQCKKDKAEKSQAFAAAAASSKKDDSSSEEDEYDKDKKTFMKSVMASWKSSKKDKKSQKNKRKCSDNDTSDSEQNYSTSFKLVALKPKRAKIGIPTTEFIEETIVNGSKTPLRILIDTGSSSSIILKKFINKSLLVKNSRTTN
jgi:hypothetical protein